MSKLKVDQIYKATGASPAIFTLPAADGTSGQVLKTDGAGNLSWTTIAPGGITNASQWRLSADFTGGATPVGDSSGVIEQVDNPVGFGVLGDPMIQSSGIFTFPETGYWMIKFDTVSSAAARNSYNKSIIMTTTNDSTYVEAASAMAFNVSGPITYSSSSCVYIMDVAVTSTHKVRFDVAVSSGTTTWRGDTILNETCMTFIRLADRP